MFHQIIVSWQFYWYIYLPCTKYYSDRLTALNKFWEAKRKPIPNTWSWGPMNHIFYVRKILNGTNLKFACIKFIVPTPLIIVNMIHFISFDILYLNYYNMLHWFLRKSSRQHHMPFSLRWSHYSYLIALLRSYFVGLFF